MIAGRFCWIACAILFAGVAFADGLILLSGPTATAQVGIPYSSAFTAIDGFGSYTFTITSGSLPPGLLLNSGTGVIAGTPTAAGVFTFTCTVNDAPTDAVSPSSGPDNQAALRRRSLAASGNHPASASSSFTITVSAAAQTVAAAPTSPWTLAFIITGLAAFGFFRLRLARS